jgi:hypothetical protein
MRGKTDEIDTNIVWHVKIIFSWVMSWNPTKYTFHGFIRILFIYGSCIHIWIDTTYEADLWNANFKYVIGKVENWG